MAIVDARYPEIDLATAEVALRSPAIEHDPAVLDAVGNPGPFGSAELAGVPPGRYPLMGWCVIRPGDWEIVELSPAQAAAATVSFFLDGDDPLASVRELGELFTRIPAYGLWYSSDIHMADLVADAFTGASSVGEP